MSPDELDRICKVIIGREWQRPLARVLGTFHPDGERQTIDDRLVRRWANGTRPIPQWVEIALGLMAARRVAPLRQRLIELEDIALDLARNRGSYPQDLVAFLEYRADTPWQNRIGELS